jgi:hypothetical protein
VAVETFTLAFENDPALNCLTGSERGTGCGFHITQEGNNGPHFDVRKYFRKRGHRSSWDSPIENLNEIVVGRRCLEFAVTQIHSVDRITVWTMTNRAIGQEKLPAILRLTENGTLLLG